MKLKIALIGNQNAGKTTLFNQLTGSRQHVGNFPGVTVEKKSGIIKKQYTHVFNTHARVGQPVTGEEVHNENFANTAKSGSRACRLTWYLFALTLHARRARYKGFLIREKPDAIINILDATNIERNLYLSLQVMEMHIPMVIALNMMDEVKRLETQLISIVYQSLHLDIVPIVANKTEGVSELVQELSLRLFQSINHKNRFLYRSCSQGDTLRSPSYENIAEKHSFPLRFASTNSSRVMNYRRSNFI